MSDAEKDRYNASVEMEAFEKDLEDEMARLIQVADVAKISLQEAKTKAADAETICEILRKEASSTKLKAIDMVAKTEKKAAEDNAVLREKLEEKAKKKILSMEWELEQAKYEVAAVKRDSEETIA